LLASTGTRYRSLLVKVGMHRIVFLPDIRPAGYPANQKAGYRIYLLVILDELSSVVISWTS
jgi:hypothetical protein